MKGRTMAVTAGIVVAAAGTAALVWGVPTWDARASEHSRGFLQWQNADVVAMGAEIYDAECAACHGADLEGQPDWRERLPNGRLPAPPHDATGHTWHHPDAMLFAITKHGTEALVGGDYRSDMGGFGDRLTDPEIVAVLSYIKSTWPQDIIDMHDEVNARAAAQ